MADPRMFQQPIRRPQRPMIQVPGGTGMPGMNGLRGIPMAGMSGQPMQFLAGLGAGGQGGGQGKGQHYDPSQDPDGANAFGLPPQDLINALYDIFGDYPRKNCLPYANGFNLLSSTGNALTALGTATPAVTTTADAAHVVTLITGASTGEYSATLRTDSSDRILMPLPIHSSAMVGTAERPFPLPKPLLLAPNTTISFSITDLSNATNEIWFALWGFKIYRRQFAAA
jgi:hypothetical protein